jgi:hypothetical protein
MLNGSPKFLADKVVKVFLSTPRYLAVVESMEERVFGTFRMTVLAS